MPLARCSARHFARPLAVLGSATTRGRECVIWCVRVVSLGHKDLVSVFPSGAGLGGATAREGERIIRCMRALSLGQEDLAFRVSCAGQVAARSNQMRPNPSLELTRYGRRLWPRGGCYAQFPPRGHSRLPPRAAQLER